MSKLERIEELAQLKDGWLDGEGKAPTELAINNAKSISTLLDLFVEKRWIYPTPYGGIQIELDKCCEVVCCGDGTIKVEVDE
jgi:hypothetical protein